MVWKVLTVLVALRLAFQLLYELSAMASALAWGDMSSVLYLGMVAITALTLYMVVY